MAKILPFFLIILLIGCSPDRTTVSINDHELKTLKQFQNVAAKHKLKIADDAEPGEKLKLCITIVDKETKQKLANRRIRFYHTSAKGEYEPRVADEESTARLSGEAITDDEGRVFVETILPGDYGSSPDNRHIHTTIFGAKPEGYDIHFKQYTGFMGKDFISGSDQHFLADLKRDKDGSLVTFVTMEPKNIER